jgi:hypothetical protein
MRPFDIVHSSGEGRSSPVVSQVSLEGFTMRTKTKRRLTADERTAIQQEALTNAVQGITMSNYPAIFEGFLAKGIPEDQIRPRENVFTYHAWRALGRQVRRGEHGVKVTTFVPMDKKETDPDTGEDKRVPLGKRALDRHGFPRLANRPHPAITRPTASAGRWPFTPLEYLTMANVKLSHETIKRPLDECNCDWCGQSLLVGDRVHYDLDHGTAYCSRACANHDHFDRGYGPVNSGVSWW